MFKCVFCTLRWVSSSESISYTQREELCSLKATGRYDFLPVAILVASVLCLTRTSRRGWETLSRMECSLNCILLSVTAIRWSSSTPQHHWPYGSAVWVCWNLLTSVCCPSTANRRALATTVSWSILSIARGGCWRISVFSGNRGGSGPSFRGFQGS